MLLPTLQRFAPQISSNYICSNKLIEIESNWKKRITCIFYTLMVLRNQFRFIPLMLSFP
jgi:hypothetical protein